MSELQVEIIGRIPGRGNVPAILIARRPSDGAFAVGAQEGDAHFRPERWIDPLKALDHATKVLEGNARADTQPGAFKGFAIVLTALSLWRPDLFFPGADAAASVRADA